MSVRASREACCLGMVAGESIKVRVNCWGREAGISGAWEIAGSSSPAAPAAGTAGASRIGIDSGLLGGQGWHNHLTSNTRTPPAVSAGAS